ncbi:MAG: response regulator transcription factor [Rhodopila sp.]|jgi:two-component system KDP operon response regulator KdpE
MMQDQSHLRILVVDDEPGMRRLLQLGLTSDGHIVSETDRGTGALEAVRRREADLIVLDLGLPDLDGLQVIKRIRYAKSYVPIIVLSNRGDEAAKVAALDRGADDYITKPFGIDELLARIRVLRRYRVQPQADQTVLTVGDLDLNLVRRNVTVRGFEVKLAPREYELLRLLMTHAGKVLTHGFILRQVWGTKEAGVQYLRIYIRALRQKIDTNTDQSSLIVTEPGVGYRLHVADETVRMNDG